MHPLTSRRGSCRLRRDPLELGHPPPKESARGCADRAGEDDENDIEFAVSRRIFRKRHDSLGRYRRENIL